jgi:hypothetical protein
MTATVNAELSSKEEGGGVAKVENKSVWLGGVKTQEQGYELQFRRHTQCGGVDKS